MAKPKYRFDMKSKPFVNPYNFVDVDFERRSSTDIESRNDTKTGWIDYRITVRTPLALPDTETAKKETVRVKTKNGYKEELHPNYKFITTPEGELMVPGSSVRGVIRNVFETVTDSCFSTVKEKQFITARQMTAGKPGILEIKTEEDKDGDNKTIYTLYEADFYMLRSKGGFSRSNLNKDAWDDTLCRPYDILQDREGKYIKCGGEKYYSGSKVHFQPLKDNNGNPVKYVTYKDKKNRNGETFPCGKLVKCLAQNGEEGYLVLGENIYGKHHERIFVKGAPVNQQAAAKVAEAYEGMLKTLEVYRDKGINKNYPGKHSGYKTFEKMKKNGCIPVYYKWNNRNLYLQLAAVGRVAFNSDMVKLTGKKSSCKIKTDLCKACALFGMTGNDAIESRLRFEDALIDKQVPYSLSSKTLAELGGPRVAYMPFYSTMEAKHDPNYVGYDDRGIGIRGRKFYWHHEPKETSLSAAKTGRNATMEILDAGAEFTGKIYFDDITTDEIRELIWSINFWENKPQGKLCHKIGHGKPLGLGSCKITIEAINYRRLDDEKYTVDKGAFESNDIFEISADPFSDSDDNTVRDLLGIVNFHAMDGNNVSYPYVGLMNKKSEYGNENDYAPHKWFTENKQNRNRKIMQLLPYIDENQDMYPVTATIEKGGRDRSSYSGHNKGGQR